MEVVSRLRELTYAVPPGGYPGTAGSAWYVEFGKQGTGAFLGALFAFVFLKVADYTKERFERERRDHRALNRLQHLLNDYLGILSDNAWVVEDFKKAVSVGNLHFSFPRPLPVDRTLYDDLLSLALVNKLRSAYDSVRKINDDLENARLGYEDIKDIYLKSIAEGAPNKKFYIDNCEEMIRVFETIARFQTEFMNTDVRNLLSHARVQVRKGKWIGTKLLLLGMDPPDVTKEEIGVENEQLGREMEEMGRESRARINRLEGRPPHLP